MKKVVKMLLVLSLLTGCEKEILKEKENVDLGLKDIKKEVLVKESLRDYVDEISDLIDEIKKMEPEFNVDDYKMNYKLTLKEKEEGFITLVYYIDDNIKTNKMYRASFENYEIKEVSLKGVKEENLGNIDKADLSMLKDEISKFESKKLEMINKNKPGILKDNTILKDNKLSLDNFKESVKEFEELYSYDFNISRLTYELEIGIGSINQESVTFVDSISIDL